MPMLMATSTKCLFLFLLYTLLFDGCFGCSCEPGSLSRSRRTAICDNFSESENVFRVSVQEVYCKCFPEENDDTQFSCIKYEREGGLTSGETQESFSCDNSVDYSFSYLNCDQVSDELRVDESVDPIVLQPVTNLTEAQCSQATFETTGSGCDLGAQPCYYVVNITRVYKGNYTVGSLITASGPDVLTSCGEIGRILRVGSEYVVGIGGPCDPIDPWSLLDVYNPEDLDLLQRLTTDDDACGSGNGIMFSTCSLIIAILVSVFGIM